jgi:hypothetical protein
VKNPRNVGAKNGEWRRPDREECPVLGVLESGMAGHAGEVGPLCDALFYKVTM